MAIEHERGVMQWQLAENSAAAYERYLVGQLFAAWAEELIDFAGLGLGERVLDVCCGTGSVARRAAEVVGPAGSVAGLDLNENMLNMARSLSAGSRPAIEWRQGDAQELPFADDSFDAVFCQQALGFLADPDAALAQMRRVLAPGGRAAVEVMRSLDHHPAYERLAAALERHAGPEAGAMMRSPFPAWSREELRSLLEGAGLRDVRVRISLQRLRHASAAEFLRQEAASSPLAGAISSLSEMRMAALLDEIEAALLPYADDEGIIIPMECYMACGRR